MPETASETEVFYTFAWAPRQRGGARPRGERREKGKGQPPGRAGGGKPGGKDGPGRGERPKSVEARPPRKEKPIDPDNPFAAALMGLRTKP